MGRPTAVPGGCPVVAGGVLTQLPGGEPAGDDVRGERVPVERTGPYEGRRTATALAQRRQQAALTSTRRRSMSRSKRRAPGGPVCSTTGACTSTARAGEPRSGSSPRALPGSAHMTSMFPSLRSGSALGSARPGSPTRPEGCPLLGSPIRGRVLAQPVGLQPPVGEVCGKVVGGRRCSCAAPPAPPRIVGPGRRAVADWLGGRPDGGSGSCGGTRRAACGRGRRARRRCAAPCRVVTGAGRG
jgi:hypothetical protein